MLEVVVDLVPSNGKQRRKLFTAQIVNDCTGSNLFGNYNVFVIEHDTAGQVRRAWKRSVHGFPRTDQDALDLLAEAIEKARQER